MGLPPTDLEERFLLPENWEATTMVNGRGQSLHCSRAVPDKIAGHVLLVEGLGEFTQKYAELARDFNRHALAFHVFDRQGQGLSGRNTPHPYKIHCDDYRDDVADIEQYAMTKIPRDGTPVILLGHSTGSLLCVPALHQDSKRPESQRLYASAVLCDPLWGFHDPRIKGRESMIALLPLLSQKKRQAFVPGADPQWRRRDDACSALQQQAYSTDAARAQVNDYWPTQMPELRVAGATMGWLREMSRAMKTIRQKNYIESITHPVTICTADMALHVDEAAITKAGARFPHGRFMAFPEGKHELLMERDSIRNNIINEVTRLAYKP